MIGFYYNTPTIPAQEPEWRRKYHYCMFKDRYNYAIRADLGDGKLFCISDVPFNWSWATVCVDVPRGTKERLLKLMDDAFKGL